MRHKLVLLGLVSLLACLVGFVSFTPKQALLVLRYAGYWIVLPTFGLFLVALISSLRGNPKWVCRLSSHRGAIIAVVVGSVWLHLQEPHEFKIVMDEVVLGTTAMDLHFQREESAPYRGIAFMGTYDYIATFVDKRPIFFPFLLACVHDLTGYRPENAFWLNALLTPILLSLVFLVCQRLAGTVAGYVGVFLLCTIPLVAQNACGAGFEILNLVMITLCLWLGLRYAEFPSQSSRLSAFVLCGILLAQVRYESALFVAPVGISVLFIWWRQKCIDLPFPVIFAPLLLVTAPLHLSVFKISEASWQLNDIAGADHPFGFRYFYDNVGHAMNFYLNFDGHQPNSALVAVFGVLAVGFFVLTFYREYRTFFTSSPVTGVFSIFIISLLAHTLLMLCYFWGRFDDPVIRRLSLPSHLLFIFAIIFVVPRLITHVSRWWVVAIATMAYFFGFSVPAVAQHRYSQENFAARTNTWLAEYIRQHADQRILAIDNASGLQWVLYRQTAVSVDGIGARPEAYFYQFKTRNFDDYLVVQKLGVDYQTGLRYVGIGDEMEGFVLQPVREIVFSPTYAIRMSRVISVDEEEFKRWVLKRKKLVPVPKTAESAMEDERNKFIDNFFKLIP